MTEEETPEVRYVFYFLSEIWPRNCQGCSDLTFSAMDKDNFLEEYPESFGSTRLLTILHDKLPDAIDKYTDYLRKLRLATPPPSFTTQHEALIKAFEREHKAMRDINDLLRTRWQGKPGSGTEAFLRESRKWNADMRAALKAYATTQDDFDAFNKSLPKGLEERMRTAVAERIKKAQEAESQAKEAERQTLDFSR